MIALLMKYVDIIFNRDNRNGITPFPFGETTAVISSIIFGIIGLVIFSYYAQSPSCISYNDKRRTFTTFALIAVMITLVMYSLVYIGAFMINYKVDGEYNAWAIVAGILTFGLFAVIPSMFIGRAIDLTLKPENEYDLLYEIHPYQYSIMLVVSGFLILGSTLPLMNYVGSKIINPPEVIILDL